MSNENLAQIETLQEQEGKEAISKIQEIKQKAEVSFEGDVVGAAEKAISELTGAGNETTKSMQAETNIAINTAKSMGGTEQKVKEISESVQNEVSTAVESGKQEISEVKNENQELFTLQDEIRKKYGSKIKNQDGGLGFSNSNTIKELHHPFLYVGHGSHYFDGSLLNKKMKLGDLLNKEEEIKKEKRDKTIQEIQELRKQKEAIV